MGKEPATVPRTSRERRFGAGASLRRKTARGTIVNGAFLTAVNGLSMLRGFVVAAFLTTEEYGVLGILIVMYATLFALKQVGVGEKYVQQEDEDQVHAFQVAMTFELIVSSSFAVIGVGLMFAAAALYDAPQVVGPGLVLLLTLPLAALQMPLLVFYREMNFVKQRLLQSVEPIVGFVVAVGLAVAGAGYWSVVAGVVAGAATSAAIAALASPHPLRLVFDRSQVRTYFSFSWPILVGALASVVVGQGLVAAGNAAVGLAGIGIIALTATISQFVDRADRAITDTIYPAICAVRDRTELLYEAFVTSNRLALMWAVPFGVAVALFAEDLLVGLLGSEWEPGVTLLQATALTLAIHQVGFNWQAFYRARGETRPIAVGGVVGMLSFFAVTLPLVLTYELDGLAAAVVASEVVFFALRMFYLRRLFPELRALRHLWRALAPSLPGVAAVLGLRLLDGGGRELLTVGGEVLLYVAITGAFTWWLERPLIREVVSYLSRGEAAVVRASAR